MNIYVREDYKTVTEALLAANDGDTVVIPSGTYREKLFIRKKNITLVGDGYVTLCYDDGAGNPAADGSVHDTFTCAAVNAEPSATGFRAENITFENNYSREDPARKVTQALALSCGADAVFEDCCFLGWQDTVYVWGRTKQYFKDCYIEGSVDFIFGDASVLLEGCHINCVREKSYISAASTAADTEFGLVFYHCDITANHGCDNIYLGRPWRAERSGVRSHTAFLECTYHFKGNPEGWLVWHAPEGHERERIRYEEYGNVDGFGRPVDVSKRIRWSYQLSQPEAEALLEKALKNRSE